MPNQAPHKPTGPRLPAAKDAAKLMQEGVLAMERDQWERAENRLMAALEQLRQLDPVSWPMHRALGLVAELRLTLGDPETAKRLKREQVRLAEKLKGVTMDYFQMTSPCGIDCFNCPLYAAKENQDLRNMIADNLGIPSEMAQCSGCRAQKGEMPFLGWTEPCPQFTCVTEKGHDFCNQCDDFPCEWLHPSAFRADSVPHNYKLYNLLRIKKMGLEEWAVQEAGVIRENYFTGEHPILQKAGKSMKK